MNDAPPIMKLTWRIVGVFVALEAGFTAFAIYGAFLVCGAFAAPATQPASSSGSTAERAIRQVLDSQVQAWNRGDLDGFMVGYWKSDELTFYSGDTVTKGWQATFDRYRKRYQGEGKEMGRLEFNDLRVDVLSDDAAITRGRYKLTLKDGTTPTGLFTLILRKLGADWRIVHDHTSAAEIK